MSVGGEDEVEGEGETDEEAGNGSKKDEGLADHCEEGMEVEAEVREIPETEE